MPQSLHDFGSTAALVEDSESAGNHVPTGAKPVCRLLVSNHGEQDQHPYSILAYPLASQSKARTLMQNEVAQ